MIRELKAISRARDFPIYNKGVWRLDAVFASTSPAHWMDIARADAAVDAVRDLYRSVENYQGLWIAGGTLGGLPYEKSQRKGIVDRFMERGVEEDRIVQIDGKDTVDKVRELMKIPEITEDKSVEYLGIASYPLHIARFNLVLKYAQRKGYLEGLKIIGIPTDNRNRPETDKANRPVGDFVAGWAGLLKDARRLERYGFEASIPGQNSKLYRRIRSLNSEDR